MIQGVHLYTLLQKKKIVVGELLVFIDLVTSYKLNQLNNNYIKRNNPTK